MARHRRDSKAALPHTGASWLAASALNKKYLWGIRDRRDVLLEFIKLPKCKKTFRLSPVFPTTPNGAS